MLKLAIRMTLRDWRAGQLRFLLIAMIVAVSALSSVGFFVERIRTSLNRDALQLLGADLVLNADQKINPAWREKALAMGLQVGQTTTFPSMALAGSGEQSQSTLVALKAVSDNYPLRGRLKLANQPGQDGVAVRETPASGVVWVDASVLEKLKLNTGDNLRLGDASFTVRKIITNEPDRGGAFINFAPRVMLGLADLERTGLIQAGSRVSYRLLVAGNDAAKLKEYTQWLEQEIARSQSRGVRMESLQSGRPEMQATLQRAEQFLGLVGLLTALLAAVAIAMAARRFMLRHIDAYAMLRFFGLAQTQVLSMFVIEFLLLGVVASAIGAALGFACHFVLLEWLSALVTTELSPPSWVPALQALATGMVLLLGFAIPPILQLRNVPHNQVIRREQETPRSGTLLVYGMGLLGFVALMLWQAGDVKLGLLTSGGFLLGFVVFAVSAWLALNLLHLLRPMLKNPSWRFAITGLQRRRSATILQIVSLSLGLMALLLLTVERSDLLAAWEKATPADAPNRFVINIQTEQKTAIQQRVERLPHGKNAPLYPMIRGRLIAVNGKPVKPADYQEDRAQRLVDREFNLSTLHDLPTGNEIVAGQWYPRNPAMPQASVEQDLAATLKLKLGDKLKFDIGGQQVEAEMTSLRKLEWNSMRVNFFVIINPEAMRDLPQTWITAFHLPPANAGFANQLTADFPNLTVVDVSALLKQVRDVLDQVIAAVQFLFIFTLLAGVLVLYAALVGSQDERAREAALLRALGATRRQLSRAQALEFLLIGTLAGLLAASGAAAIGWALATYVFKFAWLLNVQLWLFGGIAGALCALLGGWYGLRQVLSQPPLQSLRAA